MRTIVRAACSLVLLGALAVEAQAQGFQGGIRGAVRDPGGVIPGAEVTLTNEATNVPRNTMTNNVGEYNFPNLPPGTYTLMASLPGYKTYTQAGIRIGAQQFLTLDVRLEVGGVQETITVTGEAPLIETSNASVASTIDRTTLETLPTVGRNAFFMAVTTPNVVPSGDPIFVRQQDQTNSSLLSLGGGPRRGNNYTLEGVPITDMRNRAVMIPNIESLEELKVQVSTYDAEMGRTGGGVFNAVGRSGSNTWHGSATYQNRPSATNGQLFFPKKAGLPKADTYYHTYGGSFGGPIKHDRTFFFASTEGYKTKTVRTTVMILPTELERSGDFSQSGVTIFDPATFNPATGTRQPFPNNRIPANRINPVSRAMLEFLPLPTTGRNRAATAELIDVANQATVKVDHRWTDTLNTSGMYAWYDSEEPETRFFGKGLNQNPADPGDGALFRLVSEAHRIRLAHLFDPVLAVHTSVVEPLPHQITAVYDAMLPRQPLRFLLADDPGAGKTIMAGLLIKELIARGDLQRCLVVCPGSLAEQWQDELFRRFHLPFEILTNDKLEAARTGNWFLETNLVIARLDKLSRNEDVQEKLQAPDGRWDLIVCDEAHKMSATFFGGEIKYTKRYKLGQLLSTLTRHFLLMTATPHNGKEEDFQLFMALLDGDRFEGRFRDGVHVADVSDLMRRMVKESLLKFDATPLFPERIAYTVPYKLSNTEAQLYRAVTEYVREEFNRAESLQNDKRAGTVGFALTILQRRLASSPEAIYQSLRRRRERLESRLRELELLQRGGGFAPVIASTVPELDAEDVEDLEDAPDNEVEAAEEEILDQATASRTIAELKTEIESLRRLESLALTVRRGGDDRKWRELASLLGEIFTPAGLAGRVAEAAPPPYGAGTITPPVSSPRQKLVLFTEHRDTLNYLESRITTLLGRKEAVVIIHGGMGREERMTAQESFRHDPEVQVLLATDAAGEGINLQRAHLMVNYDLPWNPNRIEQRFGRIHRIGQTEVCHLWNLVAEETREGDVYRTLLEKLEEARKALGGQVFDVLGKLQFEGQPLRDLLIKAIRYGEQPDVRARLTQVVANAFDRSRLQDLLEERALAHAAMDASRVYRIREEMERAEARRLQPHYIESFFLEAFQRLGGTTKQRESRRYEVTHVPAPVRNRDRVIGIGEPVLPRYERIAFEKSLVAPQGQPLAAFVCPGHPLLDATIDLTLERDRDLLRRGTVLVDERDPGTEPRVTFYLEHSIQDASLTRSGDRRVVSKRMLYVELDAAGHARHLQYAPYLDYRPLADDEPAVEAILARPECAWIGRELEQRAQAHAVAHVVPEHLAEVRSRKLDLITKTEAAVKDRLTKEISYWDHRAEQLKLQEQSGKPNARLNSGEARKRADALQARLEKRMEELKLERQIAPLPPVILGGMLIVPLGLIANMTGRPTPALVAARDTQASAARARAIVMEIERRLGFEPTDRELEKLGYDIESRVPGTGKLRFIEVKGRVSGAETITVTKNEILYSLNKPEDFILAIVEFMAGDAHRVHYLRCPFHREPDFGVTSVNYDFPELLTRAEAPR